MRKIEKEMLEAIRTSKKWWTKDNTCVERIYAGNMYNDKWCYEVCLYGNAIARIFTDEKDNKQAITGYWIDTCTYETNTTKSRLNALGDMLGFCINQIKGVWYITVDGVQKEFDQFYEKTC